MSSEEGSINVHIHIQTSLKILAFLSKHLSDTCSINRHVKRTKLGSQFVYHYSNLLCITVSNARSPGDQTDPSEVLKGQLFKVSRWPVVPSASSRPVATSVFRRPAVPSVSRRLAVPSVSRKLAVPPVSSRPDEPTISRRLDDP